MAERTVSADFFSQQRTNRRRSFFLVAIFFTLFILLGFGVDAAWLGSPWPIATSVALVAAVAMSAGAYFRGAQLVMASLCAQPLDATSAEHRELRNIVAEMAIAAGQPPPSLFLIPDSAPNALAAGRDPRHAVIGVTTGLLELLDREETQGVIAHEMSHIANRDTLTMTLVGILFGGAVMLADWARRTMALPSDRRRGNIVLFATVLILIVLTPLLSRLLAMAVSRQREYLADATAVQLTRNPLALARALEKIGGIKSDLRAATRGTAHMFINNPWARSIEQRSGRVADLFSSHPPIVQRIAILRQMAYADRVVSAGSDVGSS